MNKKQRESIIICNCDFQIWVGYFFFWFPERILASLLQSVNDGGYNITESEKCLFLQRIEMKADGGF